MREKTFNLWKNVGQITVFSNQQNLQLAGLLSEKKTLKGLPLNPRRPLNTRQITNTTFHARIYIISGI